MDVRNTRPEDAPFLAIFFTEIRLKAIALVVEGHQRHWATACGVACLVRVVLWWEANIGPI